ncbi:MAG TPA: N-methyl-L-tryptophan oxidase [Blastocatellia bacterium]|nr:N-methyl-L-tryptophan oxidase [Blastocatellia bacterium]
MTTCDVAIIGAGVMGAAAACELAEEGSRRVVLFDMCALPNPRAASFDHSKVFRSAYPDAFYVRLAVESLGLWRALETETRLQLLTAAGLLLLGRRRPSLETDSYDALRSMGLEAELLESRAAARRFPQFNPDAFDFAVFDPSGAIIHAERAVRALLELATRRGVNVLARDAVTAIENTGQNGKIVVTTESGASFECAQAVAASGPWTRKLLPELAGELTTTRQEIVYFDPAIGDARGREFDAGRFPIFADFESGYYGFPVHHGRAMKIANHNKGAEVDPDSMDDTVGEEFIAGCREFFTRFIPGLANARVALTRVCVYNNTPDDDFILDWHPQLDNVLIATGFSGHGFKFAPIIGRIAAELIRDGQTAHNIDRFALSRFAKRRTGE